MTPANGEIRYQVTLPDEHVGAAAELYDEAFGAKFALAVPSRRRRIALLEKCFMGAYAVVALAGDRLVGLAGFHASGGSLTGGITIGSLLVYLGPFRGLRAALVFGFYERKPKKSELVMDGIAVERDYRGRGIGARLLREIADYGVANDYRQVRLDVIDTNPGARRLYERHGFVEENTESFPYLRWLLGFGASTQMVLGLEDDGLIAAPVGR